MPRPLTLTSPKIQKLATKAFKSPSMLTTAETRELGAAVVAHVQPEAVAGAKSRVKATKPSAKAKKTSAKKSAGKKPA